MTGIRPHSADEVKKIEDKKVNTHDVLVKLPDETSKEQEKNRTNTCYPGLNLTQ